MLADLQADDPRAVAQLLLLLYRDLHELADQYLRGERPGHTLQPTALVHEAFMKLLGEPNLKLCDSAQFFSMAARAMRQVLVDSARRVLAAKRGGDRHKFSLGEVSTVFQEQDVDLVALDEALTRLAQLDPQQSRVVELRFFGGLTIEQTAQALEISVSTVKREWQAARAWLYREVAPTAEGK